MKVHSRLNRSKKSPYKRILLVALAVIVVGLLVPKLITGVSRVVLYPVHTVENWFRESSASVPTFFRDRSELVNEIESLKNKLAIAVSTDLTQQRLYEENTWLRSLLSAEADNRIAAAVVARPDQLPYDLMQIDRGSSDGVVVGAPVYVGADNVIGSVIQVADNYSFVQLFTTPGFKATAFISGANVVATMEGQGGGVAIVRVPQGIPISVGNVVHVPSIEPGVFGRISYIENRPSQPEQYGYVTLEESINSIHYVAVGKSSLEPADPVVISESIEDLIQEAVLLETAESIKVDEELNVNSSSSTATSTASTTTNGDI